LHIAAPARADTALLSKSFIRHPKSWLEKTISSFFRQSYSIANSNAIHRSPSGSDNLAAQVNQQIQSQVPQQIKQKLSIQFEAVSVFALKNLLFPANNYITFSSCAVPGDLILLGNFNSAK
jgi:hypothetical protein